MNHLVLKGLVKSFGATPILRDVSLDAPAGALVVIVGPSGCGKTTLLRALAGLEAVDEGRVVLRGQDITDTTPAARDVAMVFQNYALYPTKTVRQNMSFGLRRRGVKRAEVAQRVGDTAEMLQIGHLLERKPSQLSGGQRQRVAIGRAVVRDPALFLFDEPLSNLDAALRAEMRLEIKRIHKRMGGTSVFVTHDQQEAMSLADILVVMRDGKIEQVGPPSQVFHAPISRFVAGFIGTPAMQFVPGRYAAGHIRLTGNLCLSADLSGLPTETLVEVGVRPDDLSFATGAAEDGLPARVELVQELGNTRLVHLETEIGPLNVLQSAQDPCPSSSTRICFQGEKLMAFDAQSGARIGRASSS